MIGKFMYSLFKEEDKYFKNYFKQTYKFFNKSAGDFIINLDSKTKNEIILYAIMCKMSQLKPVQDAFLKLQQNLTEQPVKSSGFWHLSDGYLEQNDGLAEFCELAESIANEYMFSLFDFENYIKFELMDFAKFNLNVFEKIYKKLMALTDKNFSSFEFAEATILKQIISNLKSLLIGNSVGEKLIETLNHLNDDN